MKSSLESGMTLNLSSWGVGDGSTGLDWLDKDTKCTGGCDNNPTSFISNIVYTTADNLNFSRYERYLQ